MSGWSQPLVGGHMLQQLPELSALSQHQPLEQDDTGIAAPSNTFHPGPSNTFHQGPPGGFMDFPKVRAGLISLCD